MIGGSSLFELNVRFQLAALIFVAVILFDFLRSKKIPTVANKKFRVVIICTVINLFCDITTVYTITHMDTVPDTVNKIAHRALYISIAAVVQSFYKYICALDSDKGTENKIVSALCNLPFAAAVASSLFLKIYFVCDNEKYAYSQGAAVMAMFFFVGILLLIIISTTVRIRIPAENKIMILCGVGIWITVCIIQYFVPNLLLTGLGISVMLLLVYLAFENPGEYTDHQTGCYNRFAFDSVLNEKMHSEKPFDIISVVIDELDAVIARFGYAESHRLMKEMADFLTSLSGKNVYVYRDDCFAFFSDNEGNTETVCCAIQKRLGGTWVLQGMPVAVRAHADVLRFPDFAHNCAEVNDILKYAGEHVESGKLVNVIDKKCADGFKHETVLVALLKNAIENDGFDVYYQPIYNLEKEKFTSAEALIRLSDTGSFGQVSPDEFIPVAEKNGLITDIGNIVLKKVCRFISGNRINELGIKFVEINLSGVQIVNSALPDDILTALSEHNVPAHFLNFEMAETVEPSEHMTVNIHRIRSGGSGFSLEDFGKMGLGLSKITDNGFDVVKLDKSLVQPCLDRENKKAGIILESLIGMIRQIGIGVAAEGVETEEMANELIADGVNYLQGYYYSRPLSEGKFLEFIKQHNMKGT